MPVRMVVAAAVASFVLSDQPPQGTTAVFANSYAVVVGIDSYKGGAWDTLTYAVKDARGIATYLRSQGFTVKELYEADATGQAIRQAFEDDLAQRVGEWDRVVFFFAGHGATRLVGTTQHGYLVPFDATKEYASLIPVSQLRLMSEMLETARHQLFILDSCFGGLAARRSDGIAMDPTTPNYVYEVTRRRARQILTAGGPNERVRDGGPDGHSYFTGRLLRGLNEGVADRNADGYITFTELFGYVQSAASTYSQTPGSDNFPGHEPGGDFIFRSLARPVLPDPAAGTGDAPAPARVDSASVYASLRTAIRQFDIKDFAAARQSIRPAVDMGNAEAMVILAKMHWDGLGGPPDQAAAVRLWESAADRGNLSAMKALVSVYSSPQTKFFDKAAAERWRQDSLVVERLFAGMSIVGLDGRPSAGEPALAPKQAAPTIPMAPTNLRIVP